MRSAILANIACAALVASTVLLSVVACSSGETPEGVEPQGGAASDAAFETDGEQRDASVPDAQQSRTCSLDDVCPTALPPNTFLRDVWSGGDGIVWAAGWRGVDSSGTGTILRWDGAAWAIQFETADRLFAIWGSSPTDIWAGGSGGLFHGTGPSSAAMTWTKVRSETIASIWGANASDIWAVSFNRDRFTNYDGKVFHYRGPNADGSDGWEIDPISSRPAAYRKVWGTSASDVWLGATEAIDPGNCNVDLRCDKPRALVLRRRPDGHGDFTWKSESMPDFSPVIRCSPGHLDIGGDFTGGGAIGSESIWLMGNLSTGPQNDVVFMGTPGADGSGNYEWSEHTFGTCLPSSGGGDCNKSSVQCPGIWFNRALWGTSPNDVYLAGDFGQLRHWDGTSFSRVRLMIEAIPMTASFYAMWGASAADLWIVGDEIALHKVGPR